MAEKYTKFYNARAEPMLCSLNLLFYHVLDAVVACLRSLINVKDIYFQLKVFDKVSSLRLIRELLADCYMDENLSINLNLSYDEYARFDLDEMEDSEWI